MIDLVDTVLESAAVQFPRAFFSFNLIAQIASRAQIFHVRALPNTDEYSLDYARGIQIVVVWLHAPFF